MGSLRKTKSVKAVLDKFEPGNEALSVVDLVERLQLEMNKTTVYRILERLEAAGTLHSFIGTNGLKWYAKGNECFSDSHPNTRPHFQCKACGKVECLTLEIAIPILPNYKVDSAKFLLVGECEKCLS